MTVAVIDSGVDADSPEFAGRIHSMSADVAGGARGYDEAGSDGHGTNVSQLLLGARNDLGTVGIAWNATLLALRADRPGSCTDTTVTDPDERGCRFADAAIAAGVERAISAGAKVINISLGGSTPAQILLDAVNRATSAGIVVVVSAGNNGDSTDPADDPANPDPFAQGLLNAGNGLVIIAGSSNETGQISAFSNRAGNGSSNYLLALGERVCCDYENGDLRRDVTADGSFVFVISGTSFSAPQVAGAAALLAQAFPNLTGRQIVDLLLTTATDVGAAGTDAVNGRGILNIPRAFAPQGTTTLAGSTTALPINRIVGGYSAVMGDAALRGNANAVVLDGYERAYAVPLNQLMRARPETRPLLGQLSGDIQTVSVDGRNLALSLSLRPGAAPANLLPLHMSDGDRRRATLLAGSAVMRLSRSAILGFAVEHGANGLSGLIAGRRTDPFLAADEGTGTRLLGHRATAGSALRLAFAPGVALTVTGESGMVDGVLATNRMSDSTGLDRSTGYSRMGMAVDQQGANGPWHWDSQLGVSTLSEQGSLLGARWSETLGQGAARSVFVEMATRIAWHRQWQMSVQWREGWTRSKGDGLIESGAGARTRGWSIDVARTGLLSDGDRLALRFAQPLRVEAGALRLNLPTAWDYATLTATRGEVLLPLVPVGREHVIEAMWSGPAFGGRLTLNSFWRDQPGHVAAASDDIGGAVRFALGF